MKTPMCLYCKYWQGDHKKAQKMLVDNPASMDLFKGWPETAPCGIDYEWADFDVRGDAAVVLNVPANFYCPYYGEKDYE